MKKIFFATLISGNLAGYPVGYPVIRPDICRISEDGRITDIRRLKSAGYPISGIRPISIRPNPNK